MQLTDNFCEWLHLVQSEFSEMPGLHLSKRQARRLWNLDQADADKIFDALEAARFLKRMPGDVYTRAESY